MYLIWKKYLCYKCYCKRGILKDQGKSRQLLMLMQLFISVKDENKNDNDTSLFLPPIK